ncbi:MAG: protein-L-isoaspartate O-methyltransferase [Zetaproteobacteria bacterium]|nr:protein-L-isoaspartate O-methyltransferase [Zetaproteobacteria bacterium]
MRSDIYAHARRNMVEYQIRCCKVLDMDLLNMIESLPREQYLPDYLKSLAYMEGHVPLPCNQEMMSPLQEASILQQLDLNETSRVLEIGTGTGFLTTLLAMRSGHVTSCEIHPELAKMARANLNQHGIDDVEIVTVNAMDEDALATAIHGTFDAIILGATLKEIPQHLHNYCNPNGQIIAFLGSDPIIKLTHIHYHDQTATQTVLFETLLQSMEGLPVIQEFVF